MQAEGPHDGPRDPGAFHHAPRERLVDLRDGHADRHGAERLQHRRAGPRRGTHLQPFEVFEGADLPVGGMDMAGRGGMEDQRLGILVLILQPRPVEVVQGLAGRLRVRADEGQLEGFGQRKPPRRVAGQGPDDIDHAVARLPVEVRWLAAELHRREHLHLDPALGSLLDLLGPWLQKQPNRDGLGRVEGVQPKRDRLRASAVRKRKE